MAQVLSAKHFFLSRICICSQRSLIDKEALTELKNSHFAPATVASVDSNFCTERQKKFSTSIAQATDARDSA